jgi:methionyl-tRNA formyltransferase
VLRLVFMGTPDFAVPSLDALIAAGYPIAAVVTGVDKPRGRGQRLTPTPVKEAALRHALPVLQPTSMKDPAFAAQLRALAPDLAVVVAFRILPRDVFTIPAKGTFNLHSSLLPKYRGAAPINWAVMNGDHETGVTTFLLDDAVDTGNMLLQEKVPIGPEEDAGIVHDRLAEVGARLVVESVRGIESGSIVPRPQENQAATPAPKIFREQCRIDWNSPASSIHNFIRGLSPHPAAWTMHGGRLLKIYKTRILPDPASTPPGSLHATTNTLTVSAADGLLDILELQQEGHKRMGIEEFLRGYKLPAGTRFD